MLPTGGVLELVTSALAAPLTIFTVLVTGYFLVRERASKREEQLVGVRLFAVPLCAMLAAVGLYSQQADAWLYGALGLSFGAWVVRTVTRHRPDAH